MGSSSWFLKLQWDGSSCSHINFQRNSCSTAGISSSSRMTNDRPWGCRARCFVFPCASESSLSCQGRCVLLCAFIFILKCKSVFLYLRLSLSLSFSVCVCVCGAGLSAAVQGAGRSHKTTMDLVFNWFNWCFCVNMKVRVTSRLQRKIQGLGCKRAGRSLSRLTPSRNTIPRRWIQSEFSAGSLTFLAARWLKKTHKKHKKPRHVIVGKRQVSFRLTMLI